MEDNKLDLKKVVADARKQDGGNEVNAVYGDSVKPNEVKPAKKTDSE